MSRQKAPRHDYDCVRDHEVLISSPRNECDCGLSKLEAEVETLKESLDLLTPPSEVLAEVEALRQSSDVLKRENDRLVSLLNRVYRAAGEASDE